MKNLRNLLLLGVIILSFSCSKDKDANAPNDSKSIEGEWRFVGIDGFSRTDLTLTDGTDSYRQVSTFPYFTVNNKGTITISGDKFSTKNLSYKLDTTMISFYYDNGTPDGSDTLDVEFDVPASSGVSPYVKVGSDSLYFSQGSFIYDASAGSPTATGGGGAKYSWSNDTLILSAKIYAKEIETDSGITATKISSGLQIIKLLK